MRNSAWYNKLWQNKMQELPLEGDADLSWQKMQGLLDKNMPVNSSVAPKPIKGLGVKLIKVLAIVTTTAVVYYGITHLLSTAHKNNKKPIKHISRADSTTQNQSKIDSTNKTMPDSIDGKDSTNTNTVSTAKTTITDSAANNTTTNNISSITKANSNAISTTTHAMVQSGSTIRINHMSILGTNKLAAPLADNHALNHRNNNPLNKKGDGGKYLRNRNRNNGSDANLSPARNSNTPANSNSIVNDTSASTNQTVAANSNNRINNGAEKSNTADTIKKTDGIASAGTNAAGTTQQAATTAAKSAKDKSNTKAKTNRNKNSTNSKFALAVKAGFNISGISGGGTGPVFGLAGSYSLTPKVSLGIGANVLQKTISGSYSNSNYKYTTVIDTNKQSTNTTDKIIVSSSEKIYNLDIPLFVNYQVSNRITFTGGPIISLPIHTYKINNTLSAANSLIDTTTVYKTIVSDANNTTINNKINFSLFGGAKLNLDRFFIEGDVLWGLTPYNINSQLGNDKIYYRSYQFGIGFYLFKPKP